MPEPTPWLSLRAILAIYDHPFEKDVFLRSSDSFWDRDLWDRYLLQWSREGYNAVVWWGANEVVTGEHLLLRLDERPEGRELSPQDNARVIEQAKWLFRRAKELGLRNFLYHHLVVVSPAFAKAHGLDAPMPVSPSVARFHNELYAGKSMPHCGVVNELTRAYTESVFAEFPRLYEDLDGFYGPLGEFLPGDRSRFYRDAVAPGLKRSGRKPLAIIHQWQTPLEDFMKNVVPKEVYDNVWLGFHGYNSEQITDAKPYPGLVEWAETTGLPTVAALYPANVTQFPFNSPRFAYEITREMKKVDNFVGFVYWEHSGRHLSPLFREALARYAKSPEPYSDEPWLDRLEEQFGDSRAAQGFLAAYDISGRIIPEVCALVYVGNDVTRRELRIPYRYFTGNFTWSWMTSPVRGQKLIPVDTYAKWVARSPRHFKGRNGSSAYEPPYFQEAIWGSQGGSVFDIVPPVHMEKVVRMGEAAFAEVEAAMPYVKRNVDEAKTARDFMNAYRLMARYYERKVAAATAALVYGFSGRSEDRAEAEAVADQALAAYEEAATFMHRELDEIMVRLKGHPFQEMTTGLDGVGRYHRLPELIELERDDRARMPEIFGWGGHMG